jgi:acylphosphatase
MKIRAVRGFGIEPRHGRSCHPGMSAVHHEVLHFSGRVQGVGFRYQTLQVAKGFEVSGFVRNLPDGRVLMEVEGEADEVETFVRAVEEQLNGYIRNTERSASRRPRVFAGFEIR